MPANDYAEKKIAEYLSRVSTTLSDLPEDERTRLLRNAENEIRAQLHKRNPSAPTQWDVDVVLASFPPLSGHGHAQPETAGPANRNAHERRSSPLVTIAGVVFVLAGIAILVLRLNGFWKSQPDGAAQQEPQQTPPSSEVADKEGSGRGDMKPGMKENPSDAPADTGPSEQPKLPEVFSLVPAAIQVVNEGSIKELKKGCVLYSDKDVTMKEYPRKIAFTAMTYVKAPFGGCSAICTSDGAVLAFGLFDVHQQEQTDRIRDYLTRNEWLRVEESPRFVLFYSNGADRMGELYWRKVVKGDELDFPPGMVLCSRQLPSQHPKLPEVLSLAPGAIQMVNEGSIKELKRGCLLYSDRDVTMKEYPKKIGATTMNYVKAPFEGCSVICTSDGTVFAIGLFDIHQQQQTDRIREYLLKNEWIRVEESPRFIFFYTNGADRMGELYWRKVVKGDELDFPAGMVLCFRQK